MRVAGDDLLDDFEERFTFMGFGPRKARGHVGNAQGMAGSDVCSQPRCLCVVAEMRGAVRRPQQLKAVLRLFGPREVVVERIKVSVPVAPYPFDKANVHGLDEVVEGPHGPAVNGKGFHTATFVCRTVPGSAAGTQPNEVSASDRLPQPAVMRLSASRLLWHV